MRMGYLTCELRKNIRVLNGTIPLISSGLFQTPIGSLGFMPIHRIQIVEEGRAYVKLQWLMVAYEVLGLTLGSRIL